MLNIVCEDDRNQIIKALEALLTPEHEAFRDSLETQLRATGHASLVFEGEEVRLEP